MFYKINYFYSFIEKFKKNQKGSVLLEIALGMIIFVNLALAIFDFSFLMMYQAAAENALAVGYKNAMILTPLNNGSDMRFHDRVLPDTPIIDPVLILNQIPDILGFAMDNVTTPVINPEAGCDLTSGNTLYAKGCYAISFTAEYRPFSPVLALSPLNPISLTIRYVYSDF